MWGRAIAIAGGLLTATAAGIAALSAREANRPCEHCQESDELLNDELTRITTR